MKYGLASVLLGLLLVCGLQSEANAERVSLVYDGDSFSTTSGKRVDLIGIDAPAFGYAYADQAHFLLSELVKDRDVKLKCVAYNKRRNVYGCYAWVYIPEYRRYLELQRELVGHGLAYDLPHESRGKYAYSEKWARGRGRGIWSTNFIAEDNWARQKYSQ